MYHGLEWGARISTYAKDLDLEGLEVNAHLPPLGIYRFNPNLPPAILVLQVYLKIYDHVKKTFLGANFYSGRGLVVLGQPGIGKLTFLIYALLRALKDGIPVIWCLAAKTSHWLQFDSKGKVSRYKPSRTLRRFAFFNKISPSETSYQNPGFVVQATSRQTRGYRGWATQFSARFWIMENWSAEEVDIEARYRQIDTSYESKTEWRNAYTPQEAFAVIGPSARHCFIPRTKVTGDVVTDFGLVNTIENLFGETENYDKVVRILAGNDPRNHTYPPGFHETFFVRHVEAENLPAHENFFDYELATPAQRKIVREKMLGKRTKAAATANSLCKCCPSVAGYAYEAFAQRDFSHGMKPIIISWSDSDPKSVTRPTASLSF
ncbi:hypothetical protein FRB95_013799 [Tulasnella sp. JGI-2019a]|nr:hypothetical protein FRB95_013799 [Tulasnella sp. JGI-2019a]